ncbi:MAG: hypothetical protein ACJ72K_15650 [Friedmanniella sp.]
MPYSAPAPRLVNPSLGLHNLVARAGHNAAYEIDVTLLDAPDHRLIRSGVLLAHRVLDGRGEWYLTAPDWQPLLPKDRIELMGHADLPEELADLIRPLRRRAPLGPVAALRCERREFALRDEDGATRALLRDDKVTVRRGGLTTARYREVMLTPVGPGLSEDQNTFLDRALLGAGSTPVARFPRLVTRLGAPATGASDIPEAAEFDPAGSFKKFVGHLLGLRLRRIVEADLAVRGGELRASERLVEDVQALAAELAGLAQVSDAEWRNDLADELDWLMGNGGPPQERLPVRLRSERYLAMLDQLVAAARAPRVGEVGAEPAVAVLGALLDRALDRVRSSVQAVADLAPGPGWESVRAALAGLEAAATLSRHLLPEATETLDLRLAEPRRLLTEVRGQPLPEDEARGRAENLSSQEAFAAGRAFERQQAAATKARASFVKAWAKADRKLTRQPALG